MSASAIAAIAFFCCLGGALVGMFLHVRLPDHHLDGASKDTVRLVMSLVATLAALVLGLLIASAKSSYDTQAAGLQQMSADIAQLDRMLVLYGPETRDLRDFLRQTVIVAHQRVWPTEGNASQPANVDPSAGHEQIDAFFMKLQSLPAKTEAQIRAQNAAWQLAASLTQIRMLLYEQLGGSASRPLLVVLIFWVSVLFTGFGLFARFNVTIVVTFIIGAISVGGAIFLILELNQPYAGLIRLSDAPIEAALASMDR